MHRKKLDNRIRVLIENGLACNHRSMFVIVGDKGRDHVVVLHHILTKASLRPRPSVLWCYKKELGFTTHRKKRMRMLQKKMRAGKAGLDDEKPFDLFVASTQIRYCYYSETHKILGNTYGMCILQATLTPNLLARTIETIEGGGLVIILLRSLTSLRQLYTLAMDVHARYRTEAHSDIVGRFNERFLLSLASCQACCVLDDDLNILPISSHMNNLKAVTPKEKEQVSSNDLAFKQLLESLSDSPQLRSLLKLCKTLDQANVVLKLLNIVAENSLRHTVSLTAARGRGKSAALGLATAGAIGSGFSNIFVTSPSPENLKTYFQFVCRGFDALNFKEHMDYEVVQSANPEFNKAIVRISVIRSHRQTVQYIHPTDAAKLGQAELVIIDEAAAIPLVHVKHLLGPYLVFMASNINGYEGTGRSLSLKLLHQLRQETACITGTHTKSAAGSSKETEITATSGRVLSELVLEESIRYGAGDPVESWLNQLLCLDVNLAPKVSSGCPAPNDCDLYPFSADTLFCFHKVSEVFLQRLMSIYVAAHYKNSPNDLQMISDAPAHHLFVLLGPVDVNQKNIPEILCVIQVCLEGDISKASVDDQMSRGKRPSGDLIPWTLAQQFQDSDFPGLSGARIVRIATHPDYQNMGYGSRAVELLQQYYEGAFPALDEVQTDLQPLEVNGQESGGGLLEEKIAPRKDLPPLLAKLSERRAERLDWLGVCYGLTPELQKFWARKNFVPVYIRQTANELTGEFSCIKIKCLRNEEQSQEWLTAYWKDFQRRFISLLGFQFAIFPITLALGILARQPLLALDNGTGIDRAELRIFFSDYDLKRLEMYSQNLVDHHLITDLLPFLARMFFTRKIKVDLSTLQAGILMALGLQHKTVDDIVKELNLPSSQILALFNRIVRKCLSYLNQVCENAIESHLGIDQRHKVTAKEISRPLEEELNEYASEVQRKAQGDLRGLISESDLAKYRIRADEDETEFLNDKLASSKKSKKRLKKMHGGGGGGKKRRR
ncbi:tRNA bind 2 and DUF1726 and Helicase RecD and GNA T acetyltr 2 domain containing protein [Trichuris trichiura]|uniref:RNA cytidine acetyltransferase n=1 Tax=Trichuris trichiura TaxID=36087 RepID=A0A077Z2X2_TRITR|nr:tRNA bind 2 and DUF1726 and Helicase RecD and GNA T acetyltr 2 domain containing protein [Trichuris trichiura]